MSVKFSYMYCLYEYNQFAILFNDYKGEHIYTYTLWFRTNYRYHYNETYTWNMTLPLDCLEYYIGGTNSPTYSIVPVDGKLPLNSLGAAEAEPGLGSVEGFLVKEE